MNLEFTAEDNDFRKRVQAWLVDNIPKSSRPEEGHAAAEFDQEWQHQLYEGGFAGISWPAEYGGAGLTPIRLLIWFEEVARANAPHAGAMSIALNHAGPTIILRGTAEQKQKYLRPILTGEAIWCQGFSEPGAGSDLAAVSTRAEVVGDELIVNGQKMWTSNAHYATYQELLVRTDAASTRHKGLSWVICDMHSPGITIQPIKNMMGEHHVNMVFYDNVRIPVGNVVGGLGAGWSVAMSTLSFERAIYFMPEMLSLIERVETLIEIARTVRLEDGVLAIEDADMVGKLSRVKTKALALRALAITVAGRLSREGQPGPEGSMIKLFVTTTYKDIATVASELLGWEFLRYGDERISNRWTYDYMWSWVLTISGGEFGDPT